MKNYTKKFTLNSSNEYRRANEVNMSVAMSCTVYFHSLNSATV